MNEAADHLQTIEEVIELVTHLIADLETNAFLEDGFSDLSMRQVLYLETISEMGHPSFSELAASLHITRPSVTTLVGKLIQNGYVEKQQDGEDRRSFHIVLTPKGQRFGLIHQNIHKKVAQTLIHHLDASEIAQLAGLLKKAVQD